MPIYQVKVHGVPKRLLVRADTAAQAKDQVLETRALTSEEMADALEAGEKIYVPGDSVLPPEPPKDPPAKAGADGKGATAETA